MKKGDVKELTKRRFKDPEQQARIREITRIIAEENAVRILVNSTGAFPMHPERKRKLKGGKG